MKDQRTLESSLAPKACKILCSTFGELAGSEALTRALVAERAGDAEGACFWAGVYHLIAKKVSADGVAPEAEFRP
ncbi:hypothetical protein [Rhizobium oryzicola]|uniref:Uncharacterized protein n=1 Tax=Rhizobium oryzicola TaxID=1232668 RepID=A0ABT8SXS6_9HYPH|nr:hypothetical protein [Rhizobium oryzicola]MDO1583100.1 hypothetical protein [Rhizobium oryzicola]